MASYTDSLREAARRFLRCKGGSIYVPSVFFPEAEKLILTISDLVPSKVEPPVICYSDGADITYTNLENENFSIGTEEPDLTYCWVNASQSDIRKSWEDFRIMVTSLASAGYPGCIGCGGPGSEGQWDEISARDY